MVDKGYIYCGVKLVYWLWLLEFVFVEVEIEYYDIDLILFYYVNKVKDGKGIFDIDIYIVVWMIILFIVIVLCGLIVGLDMEYVVVVLVGSECKYFFVEVFVDSFVVKFGWENFEIVIYYIGKEFNYIVIEYLWDIEVEELVIFGDYVIIDFGIGIVYMVFGFGEDDYNVGIVNGFDVVVIVDSCGLMMENVGFDFEG